MQALRSSRVLYANSTPIKCARLCVVTYSAHWDFQVKIHASGIWERERRVAPVRSMRFAIVAIGWQ